MLEMTIDKHASEFEFFIKIKSTFPENREGIEVIILKYIVSLQFYLYFQLK